MDKETERKTNPQRDPQQTVTKIGLAVVFLIGAALIFMGIRAQHNFASSGFSSVSVLKAPIRQFMLSRGMFRMPGKTNWNRN